MLVDPIDSLHCVSTLYTHTGHTGYTQTMTSIQMVPPEEQQMDKDLALTTANKQLSLQDKLRQSKQKKLCCGLSMHKKNYQLILMVLLNAFLIFFGGAFFSLLEKPYEDQQHALKLEALAVAKAKIMEILNHNHTLFNLLAANGTADMAFHPPVSDTSDQNWEFSSASLFSFTVITTIGYGTFAPATAGGRLFLIIFAMIGVPATGITLVCIAERAMYAVTKCFHIASRDKNKVNKAFDTFDDDGSGVLDLDEFRGAITAMGFDLTEVQFLSLVAQVDEDADGEIDREEFANTVQSLGADVTEAAGRGHRIKLVTGGIFGWMGIGCLVLCLCENWTWYEGVYFSFVTLTTIGLGDLFPSTLPGRVFLVFYAVIGLGQLAVLLTLIEGALSEIDKARLIALQKARDAANLLKQQRVSSSSNGEKKSGGGRASVTFGSVGRMIMRQKIMSKARGNDQKKDDKNGREGKTTTNDDGGEESNTVTTPPPPPPSSSSSSSSSAAAASGRSNNTSVLNPLGHSDENDPHHVV